MTEAEVFQFADLCRDLQRVFPKRLDEHEQAHLHRDYFKALRRFPLAQIEAGAEAWMQRGKFFPKPAEWIDAIPRRHAQAVEVLELSHEDARAYQRAEQLRYEDLPCRCSECRTAGVDERPQRFVPDVSADGSDRRVKDGDRVVTAGHWAHGWELARWYQARADFWNRCHELGLTSVAKEMQKQAGR